MHKNQEKTILVNEDWHFAEHCNIHMKLKEKVMNYHKIVVALATLLALSAPTMLIASAPSSGTDGRLEWKEVNRIQIPAQAIDFVYSLDGKYAFILMQNQRVLVYDQKGELQGSIPVEAGVSAIDIAPQGQLLYLIDTEQNLTTTLALDFVAFINTAESAYRGKIDAPVTIAVFSDFQ